MFFVTVFSKLEKGELFWEFGSSRTVGFYKTIEDARDTVKNNRGDIHETLYDYAVIEEFHEGAIYPFLEFQEFYKAKDVLTETGFYNMNGLTYEKIETPKEYPRYHAVTSIG